MADVSWGWALLAIGLTFFLGYWWGQWVEREDWLTQTRRGLLPSLEEWAGQCEHLARQRAAERARLANRQETRA